MFAGTRRIAALAAAVGMALCPSAQAATPAASPSPKALKALDGRLREIVGTFGVTGLSVAVIADDKVVFLQGYGVRSATAGGQVDGDTMFQLASMSKPLSSALIATYVDEGRLDWNDRVVDRLPWFRVGDPAVTADLQLQDVLSHRTDVEATNWLIDVPGVTWRDAVERLRTLPQASPVRSRMSYDNVMYSVGGLMVVEQGDDYGAALKRRLFAPTGMSRSLANFETILDPAGVAACHECELPPGAVAPTAAIRGVANVATPHVRVLDAPPQEIHWRHIATTPSSSGMSSASDLAHFLRMMLNGGTIDGHRVLKAGTVAELLRERSLAPPARAPAPVAAYADQQARIADWSRGYALGWYTARYAGVDIRHHGGGLLGVAGDIAMAPDRKVAVVVLSNDRLYASNHMLAALYSALDTVLGLQPVDWTSYMRAEDRRAEAEVAATVPREGAFPALTEPARLAGDYCHPAYGRLVVTAKGQALEISQGAQRRGRLTRVGGDRFSLRWDGPRYGGRDLVFDAGPDGGPGALSIGPMRFTACAAK